MSEVEGVTAPRALVSALAPQLVDRDELEPARNLLAGPARGEQASPSAKTTALSSGPHWKTPPAGLERLRDSLIGNTPSAGREGTPGREHVDHS